MGWASIRNEYRRRCLYRCWCCTRMIRYYRADTKRRIPSLITFEDCHFWIRSHISRDDRSEHDCLLGEWRACEISEETSHVGTSRVYVYQYSRNHLSDILRDAEKWGDYRWYSYWMVFHCWWVFLGLYHNWWIYGESYPILPGVYFWRCCADVHLGTFCAYHFWGWWRKTEKGKESHSLRNARTSFLEFRKTLGSDDDIIQFREGCDNCSRKVLCSCYLLRGSSCDILPHLGRILLYRFRRWWRTNQERKIYHREHIYRDAYSPCCV